MLSNDTRKIIDDARDTLVGQIPVPMMQCQQITLALTYKFMSDDDQRAERLGGERHYFAGDLEPYGWDKIMSLRLDDTQRSELYRAGLGALQESDSMPAVFREIFKDAVVPFGDHRTLALFLSTMDRMVYDDSEKLGDAYEYLLKTAEAQADAGQFRTPRHIIDFIVKIINPQKHEVIIDPACGTAGFLVSAYQHVKSQHDLQGGGSSLSVPDFTRLADNLNGYDISPEMTKLAMANMYLHTQDKNPNIANYDTLTSADHWNEYADVMLANPPFMTPKGGIRPHSRFRVSAKRAEVLFVDYIASHLNEHGRAGIIVPEGIIFQSQNAYRQLRSLLLDESLVAVISLPSGVFNPYSGVKTSILILDKVLAPKTDRVAFFKVENDGYDLGAQRRPIGKDDLPAVTDEIGEYLSRLREGKTMDGYQPALGHIVARSKIGADGEYNLSGERYRVAAAKTSTYEIVPFDEVCTLEYGASLPKKNRVAGPYPVMGSNGISDYHSEYLIEGPAIIVGRKGSAGEVSYVESNCFPIDTTYYVKLVNPDCTDIRYLHHLLKTLDLPSLRGGAGVPGLNRNDVYQKYKLPLPPLEVQRELVAEIEGYQRVMDGARAVVDNWQPRIAVDPEWPVERVDELCELGRGRVISKQTINANPGPYPVYSSQTSDHGVFGYLGDYDFDGEYVTWTTDGANAGTVFHRTGKFNCTNVCGTLKCKGEAVGKINMKYIAQMLGQITKPYVVQVGNPKLMNKEVARIPVPLPSLDTQQAIVSEIEAEQKLVSANHELVERMEQRIQGTIARVWEG